MTDLTPEKSTEKVSDQLVFSSSEEILKARILDRLDIYQSIARSAGFNIDFGDQTCFDHRTSTVFISIPQLLKMGVTTQREIDFIVAHELGHFKELYDDPEGYQSTINESKRADGLGTVYFHLYNALMDIYVNTNTANRASTYGISQIRGDRGEYFSDDIKSIYSDKAFAAEKVNGKRDFQKSPLCMQFANYLLNLGMEVGDDITLSPEVSKEIEKGVRELTGTQRTYKEIIDMYLRPVLTGKATAQWSATISQRKMIIDMYIRPVFERLLKADLAAGRTVEVPGGLGDYIEASKDALEHAKQRLREKNLTPAEKQKRMRDAKISDMAKEANLNPEQTAEFMKCYNKAYPTMLELASLWKRVQQFEIEYKPQTEGFFSKGSTLSIDETIRKYPGIVSGAPKNRIMYRRVYQEEREYNPKKIWLIVSPDMSGSMEDDMDKVKELTIALAGSFSIINQEYYANDSKGLRGELSIIGFNSQAHPLLVKNEDTKIADIARIFSKLEANDSTSDHLSLAYFKELLSEEIRKEIASDELLVVFLEITDGDTSNPVQSRQLINQIENYGVRVKGIKFGDAVRPDHKPQKRGFKDMSHDSSYEMELNPTKPMDQTFDHIWNSDGNTRGYRVWKPKDIVPQIFSLLSDIIDKQ